MYLDKKNCSEEFDKQTKAYSLFMSMIIIRLEAMVRRVLTNTYVQMAEIFRIEESQSFEEAILKARSK